MDNYNINLPNIRYGAGLIWTIKEKPIYILPIRDEGAPTDNMKIDGQMGTVENENIEETQFREGTEEMVIIRETDSKSELGVPRCIKDTEYEVNLKQMYKKAESDSNSSLPKIDSVFYYNADIKTSHQLPTKEINSEYKTGYTFKIHDDTLAEELINNLVLDISIDKLISGEYKLYDLESMESENIIYFDRPTAILNYETGRIIISRYGDIQYDGSITGLKQFLQTEYNWDLEDEILSTCKVQSQLIQNNNVDTDVKNILIDNKYVAELRTISNIFS
jgi:hypothetical protein